MFVHTRDLQCLDSLADTCSYVLSSGNIFQFKENPINGATHHSTKNTSLRIERLKGCSGYELFVHYKSGKSALLILISLLGTHLA